MIRIVKKKYGFCLVKIVFAGYTCDKGIAPLFGLLT